MSAGTLAAVGTVFGLAFFSFWTSIPAGIALQLSAVLVVLTATFSYGLGAALVVIVGAPLRERILRRMQSRRGNNEGDSEPQSSGVVRFVERAWARFGLIGLSLLAPVTVGAQIGAVIALGFGARPVPLVVAMTLGALAWGVVIALLVSLGVGLVSPG
jgi:Ca2+/H+ antiporter, TMEM165/GDT1 family